MDKDSSSAKAGLGTLAASGELYRRLFELSPEPLLLLTAEAVVDANPAALRAFGYERAGSIAGRHLAQLSPTRQPGDASSEILIRERVRQALQTGHGRFPWTFLRGNGGSFSCHLVLDRIESGGERVLRARLDDGERQRGEAVSERQVADQKRRLEVAKLRLAEEVTVLHETQHALRREQACFRRLFEATPEGVLVLDDRGRIVDANTAWLALFDFDLDEVKGRFVDDCTSPEDDECGSSGVADRLREGEVVSIETRNRRSDGSRLEVAVTGLPIEVDGERVGAYVVYRDIGERRTVDRDLRLAAKALEDAAEGIFILDAARRTVSINPAFSRITGFRLAQVAGRPFFADDPPVEADIQEDAIWSALESDGHWQGEIRNRRRDGEAYAAMLSLSAVRGDAGIVTHYVGMLTDISVARDYERRIEFLANHDVLTGLPNRSLFQRRCGEALARARRQRRALGLMFLDLDQFRQVNDSLGHPMGDRMLVAVGERLRNVLRETDVLGRLGGDEFAVLVEGVEDPRNLATVAQKTLDALSVPYQLDAYELSSSASMGISCFPQDGADVDTLMRNADTAMYRAKDRGRNTYQFFSSEMNARAFEELLMTSALREALRQNQFCLHYQPCVDLRTAAVTGVEALVRWDHPEQGLIQPQNFIPLAEQNGLIEQIGQWVFRAACRQVQDWTERKVARLRMAVNISARQFKRPGLVRELMAVLHETGLTPDRIHIEVTESMMMQDTGHARHVLQQAAGMGMDVAIDDFGTGHSSLSYLRDFPVKFVKIDRSFVSELPRASDSAAIVQAIITLAHNLGLKVIAEGVENRAQLEFLKRAGCDEAQGYLFGRPVEPQRLEALLLGGASLF
jgi:diguanylate cyclase (GGDEF)-like protein/PAS domain S-box-containing protein